MFPGDSYFPPKAETDNESSYGYSVDQMQIIIDLIGSPDESEMDKFKDERVKKYLMTLQPKKRKNLKRVFPGSDKNTLCLLSQFLKFDVDKRISVDQALEHPYFRNYRTCR